MGFERHFSRTLLALVILLPLNAEQKLDVTILDRQNGETNYSYVVPGYSSLQTNSNTNCLGAINTINCSGGARTTGISAAPSLRSYDVKGATFTLLLPDGRMAVVNCESKYAPKGDSINRRSCRMPLVDKISAEFDGDKAKLRWVVSIDGKKTESETYKILAVIEKAAE
jgi:hypothetical protein